MARFSARTVCLLFLFAVCADVFGAGIVAAQQTPFPDIQQPPLVKADLLAEPAAVRAGQPFWVGVRMRMRPHWHTYWRNPGDSGMATDIAWTLPKGYTAGPIVWPTPHRIPVSHLVNFGYDDEVMLLTQITPPRDLEARTADTLEAAVSWLVCEKQCIPGEAKLSLTIPVLDGTVTADAPSGNEAAFDAARAKVPRPSPWPARGEVSGDSITLNLDAPGLRADTIKSAFYFPYSGTLIDHASPQKVSVTPNGLKLDIKRSTLGTDETPDLSGILVLEEALGDGGGRQAFALDKVQVAGLTGRGTGAAPSATAAQGSLSAVLQATLLALFGGIVLNLMPCVFPVLSLKVLGLMRHVGEPPARLRLHGASYAAGVLAAFMVLAGALLAVRAAGAQVGWGFQLQSPVVVTTLAYVLLALGLSLSGVFLVGTSVAGVGSGLLQHEGLTGSFLAGVLATVVATPCTAPFMGAAVGFALTQPAATSLAVFAALGLGLALPFLVLTFVPGLTRWLPRPGAWMETLKQVLAFPLYATVAWLMWVLSQQVGASEFLAAMLGLVLVGFSAWAYGIFATSSGARTSRIALGAACAAVLAVIASLVMVGQGATNGARLTSTAAAAGVEPFSQQRLDALRSERRPVFVNMTAAWCITCLVNERAALANEAVKAAFRQKGIAYLKGDWTNQNPEITRVLESHGRSGVPLYLLYASGGDPIVLPQILTPGIVLEYLEKVTDRAADENANSVGTSKENAS